MKNLFSKDNFLTFFAITAISFGLFFGLKDKSQSMWLALVSCVVLLIFANLGRISWFKFDKGSFEAKMREAENTIRELQDLSKIMAITTLGLIKRAGRLAAGYSYGEKENIKESVLDVLQQNGISKEERERIVTESGWYNYTELDYVHHILGGSNIPTVLPHERIADWKGLRHRSLDNIATPEELTHFFEQIGLLNTEVKELIEDYEYYINHRKQRRSDVWNNRASWSHFEKQKK